MHRRMRWQVQEAKQRFGELVRRALGEGPQVVTLRGEEVVLAVAEFRRLRGDVPDFRDFLSSALTWSLRRGRPCRC